MTDIVRQNAENAAAILENPVFEAAFAKMASDTVARWRVCPTPEEREKLHLKQSLLAELRAELLEYVRKAAYAERGDQQGFFSGLFARLTAKIHQE